MTTLDRLPFDAMLALAKQQFNELIAIRPLDRLAQGDRGTPAQAERAKKLLENLFRVTTKIQQEFRSRMAGQDSIVMTLSEGNAKFLREVLLPNLGALGQAFFADSPFLFELFENEHKLPPLSPYRGMRDAVWFTADYTDIMMEDDDERRHNVDAVFELVNQPWFVPDQWDTNLRALRPLILEIEEKKIPTRIRVRLSEVHRSFTYGAWMACIALSRAVVEFALIDRAPALGYLASQVNEYGQDEYLTLNQLTKRVCAVRPELDADLQTLRKAGNQILHPKKHQNIIPTPKILREEAYACVAATTRVLESVYSRHHQ